MKLQRTDEIHIVYGIKMLSYREHNKHYDVLFKHSINLWMVYFSIFFLFARYIFVSEFFVYFSSHTVRAHMRVPFTAWWKQSQSEHIINCIHLKHTLNLTQAILTLEGKSSQWKFRLRSWNWFWTFFS